MSWSTHHTQSEALASQAEVALRQGQHAEALVSYRLAAVAEEQACEALDTSHTRTLGITVVSAAALWYKACELAHAVRVAERWLATGLLPDFAMEQLHEIVRTVQYQRTQVPAASPCSPTPALASGARDARV